MKKVQSYNKKIYQKLSKKMKEDKITLIRLSEKMQISESAICQQLKKLSNGKGIMTDSLFKIMLALDMELKDIF